MLTASIRPGEFSCGYRGRLRVLNQFPSVNKIMAALRNELHPQCDSPAEYPAAATLALVAGIPVQQFVRNHSLLPFLRAIPNKDHDVVHGDPLRQDLIGLFGTRFWRRSKVFFCEECIQTDFESSQGFAYWRRDHQLPGMTWCEQHGRQLAYNPIGKKAMDGMPTSDMQRRYEFSESEFSGLMENQIIQRYVNIVKGMLDSERPMNLIHARYLIAGKAKKIGLRIGERGKKKILTDFFLDLVPEYWIKAIYPEIGNRTSGEFFTPIDNITVGRTPVPSYALALAAFFESTDEALNYWFRNNDDLPTVRKPQRKFGRNYWNSNEVFKHFVACGGNHTKIGKELGVDPTYVRIELNAAGLPGLGLVDMRTTAQAVLDFQEGMSLDSACESNGVDKEEVEKLLRPGISKLARAINEIKQPKIRKNARSKKQKKTE